MRTWFTTFDNLSVFSNNYVKEPDIMINSKNDQIISLLNQIAADMVKRSEVDEIVTKAVAEEHDRLVSYYESQMRSMAAEYEAKIAELKNVRCNKRGNSVAANPKPNAQTFDTETANPT